MNSFLSSPLIASIVSGVAVSLIAFARSIQRILSRLDTMDAKLKDIADDVNDIKHDENIVRWSQVGPYGRFQRRRRG